MAHSRFTYKNWETRIFHLRVPLLPFTQFQNWISSNHTFEDWKAVLNDKQISDALLLASPSLMESIQNQKGDPNSASQQSLQAALIRYLTRMSSRCTPFGALASVAVGQISSSTEFYLDTIDSLILNFELGGPTVHEILKNAKTEFKSDLILRLNPTVYVYGDSYRFFRSESTADESKLALIKKNKIHDQIYTTLIGPQTVSFRALQTEFKKMGLTAKAAEVYIKDLAKVGFVQSLDQLPSVGDKKSMDAFLDNTISKSNHSLQDLRQFFSKQKLGQFHSDFQNKISKKASLHLDTNRPTLKCTISENVVKEVINAVLFTSRINNLENRHSKFLYEIKKRYFELSEDVEIPLSTALDPDFGIDLPSAGLLDSSAMPDWLVEKIFHAIRNNQNEVELFLSDLPKHDESPPIPDSLNVLCSLFAKNPNEIDDEFRVHLKSWSGPTGTKIMSRFALNDPQLEFGLREITKLEEENYPEKIFAEVVIHDNIDLLPLYRRPSLRRYEIVLGGHSSVPLERQISLSDLWIIWQEDRIALWSGRLNKEVVPRFSSAFNFESSKNPVFRFLAALQFQNQQSGFQWDWKNFSSMPWCPRIRFGQSVLAPARWRLSSMDVDTIRALGPSELKEKLNQLGAPDWLNWIDGDQNLAFYKNSDSSLKAVFDLLIKGQPAFFYELIPGEHALACQSSEGTFFNEFVLPLTQIGIKKTSSNSDRSFSGKLKRKVSYPPGSDWIYYKFYLPPSRANSFLIFQIAKVVQDLIKRKEIDQWFFVRYKDPQYHIRVRLNVNRGKVKPEELIAKLSATIQKWLKSDIIYSAQLDTYIPEIERFGGDKIFQSVSQLFHLSSDAFLFFQKCQSSAPVDKWDRYKSVVLLSLYYIKIFQITDQDLFVFLRSTVQNYNRRSLNHRRPKALKTIEKGILSETSSHFEKDLKIWLKKRTLKNQNHSSKISKNLPPLTKRLEIFVSLVHMTTNRFFSLDSRLHEHLILWCLYRMTSVHLYKNTQE